MSDNENIKPFLKENAKQPEGAGALEGSPAEQAADWIYHHVSYLEVVSFLKARKEGSAEQLLLSLMAEKEAPEELQAAAAANAAEVSERINQRLCDDMQPMRDALKNAARTLKIYAGVYSKIYQEIAEQVEVALRPYRDALNRISAYEKELECLEGIGELNERQRGLYPFVREVLQEMPEGSRPDALEVVRDKTRKYSKIRNAAKIKQKEYEDNQKAAEEIEKEIPSIISQKTEKSFAGMDKATVNAFNPRKCGNDEYYISTSNKNKEAFVSYAVNFDNLPKEVRTTSKLTAFDELVHIAAASLYAAGNEYFSISQIHGAMGNSGSPSKNQVKKIRGSIVKMNAIQIFIDSSKEHEIIPNYAVFKYNASLLPSEMASAYIDGNLVESVHLFREPPLIAFAKERNQITAFRTDLLGAPISNTETGAAIKIYLLKRIQGMRANKKLSRKILFETVCDECRIEGRERQRAPEKIKNVLKCWKDKGFIRGLSEDNISALITV